MAIACRGRQARQGNSLDGGPGLFMVGSGGRPSFRAKPDGASSHEQGEVEHGTRGSGDRGDAWYRRGDLGRA